MMRHFKYQLTLLGRKYLENEGYDLTEVLDAEGYIKELYVGGTVIYGHQYTKVVEVPSLYQDYIDSDTASFKRWQELTDD